jgi:hypothetical protein
MIYCLKKCVPYITLAILLLSPICALAQHAAPLESARRDNTSLPVVDDQFLASLTSFIVHLFGTIHIFGVVNVGSIAASATSLCPQGSAYADGCSGAPAANIYTTQHSNFFTGYANQSGQTYSTRPPWNVAGVDYPVGINAAALPGGITPTTLVDAAVSTGAGVPPGCSYTLSRVQITCQSGSSLVINGYDFSGDNPGDPASVFLVVQSPFSGPCTIENSKFGWNSNPWNVFELGQFSGCTSLTLKNNYVDLAGAPNTLSYVWDWNYSGNGSITLQYNAIYHLVARVLEADTRGSGSICTFRDNYIEGFTYIAGSPHGEISLSNTGGGCDQAIQSYNTILEPASAGCAPNGSNYCDLTAPISPYIGQIVNVSLLQADHNVLVGNFGQQAKFTGYITGTTLTVTAVSSGTLGTDGANWNFGLFGSGVIVGTKISAQTSGTTGGVGVYTVTSNQTLGNSASPVAISGGYLIEGDAAIRLSSGSTINTVLSEDNYIDPTGTFGAFVPSDWTGTTITTIDKFATGPLVDTSLIDGSVCTPNVTSSDSCSGSF